MMYSAECAAHRDTPTVTSGPPRWKHLLDYSLCRVAGGAALGDRGDRRRPGETARSNPRRRIYSGAVSIESFVSAFVGAGSLFCI
jgi:hypothetical protein